MNETLWEALNEALKRAMAIARTRHECGGEKVGHKEPTTTPLLSHTPRTQRL